MAPDNFKCSHNPGHLLAPTARLVYLEATELQLETSEECLILAYVDPDQEKS